MIYEIETPDGRIIEVEGEAGKENEAIAAVKQYLANENISKDFDDNYFHYTTGVNATGLRT